MVNPTVIDEKPAFYDAGAVETQVELNPDRQYTIINTGRTAADVATTGVVYGSSGGAAVVADMAGGLDKIRFPIAYAVVLNPGVKTLKIKTDGTVSVVLQIQPSGGLAGRY